MLLLNLQSLGSDLLDDNLPEKPQLKRRNLQLEVEISSERLQKMELAQANARLLALADVSKAINESDSVAHTLEITVAHARKILHGEVGVKFEGSGIGLAICSKVVQLHHCTISASAEVNRGTTFKIILPIHQA